MKYWISKIFWIMKQHAVECAVGAAVVVAAIFAVFASKSAPALPGETVPQEQIPAQELTASGLNNSGNSAHWDDWCNWSQVQQ